MPDGERVTTGSEPTEGTGSAPRRCECRTMQPGNGEPYCPRHRYRWEYEQDEQNAHRALDELGAPRVEAPPPNDLILSVAGRVRKLGSGHDEQTEDEALKAVLRRNGRPETAPELQVDFERRREQAIRDWAPYVGHRKDGEPIYHEDAVAAVVEALREEGDPELAGGYFDAADFIEERFKPSAPERGGPV